MTNLFRARDFFEWYGTVHPQLRTLDRTGRFLPQIGNYLTRLSGQSSEFLDYGEYAVGDDPRLLSKRQFARTRRWFVKRHHHRSPVHVALVADATSSMFFPDTGESLRQKWVRQSYVIGYLSREFLMAGDFCDVYWAERDAQEKYRLSIKPVRSLRDWHELVEWMSLWGTGRRPENELSQKNYDCALFCSDFIFPKDLEVIRTISVRPGTGKCLGLCFRVSEEETGQIPAPVIVEDSEGSGIHSVVSEIDREHYLQEYQAQEKRIHEAFDKQPFRTQTFRNVESTNLPEMLHSVLRWSAS